MKFIGASGEVLDAHISKKLLLSIFNKTSPLHDGAVIIANGKIKAANAVLPISENPEYQNKYGLRHLSAIGITEQTDALALIVSEERGTMAYAIGGKVTENISRQDILDFLTKEFSNDLLSAR
jgi:DNA integrity scanning protein DisA with diadenylate cyclase activity